jgi:integrase
MAKLINKLTDLKVRKAGAGLHADGDGLYLQVRGATAKSWLYRFMLHGKAREMGLGAFPATSLEAARAERDRCKRLRQAGYDPIEARKQERLDAKVANAQAVLFSTAALEYMAAKAPQWGNEKHRKQWIQTLRTYAEPILGSMPVQLIATADIKKVLDPIWTTKSETASRLRGRIELILDYCQSIGYRKGDNPARWRGNLRDLMPAIDDVRETEHHPSLSYQEIPLFMEKLRAEDNTAARSLEWVILTATRANEALKALPDEVNYADRVWTIPKARMKGRKGKKRVHRVPLTRRAVDVLDLLPRVAENPFIFQGQKAGTHLSDGALRVLLGRMGYGHVTTHGFRSTFRTWAAEQTRFPREVLEKALAHVVGDETEQAYDRGDLFEKRRQLMDAWAGYCASKPVSRGAKVVSISSAA